MRRALLAAILAGLPAGPAAVAGPLAFPAVDTDRDGLVTWEEAHRAMPRLAKVHFDKCDPGGDGLIDRGEYPLLQTFYWMNYVMSD
ncbi:MAG TPA: hypothetical protein VM891_01800 [Amaricoccus sp.]|jgi:hypothetical protein|nr:hypothetical protein [Amaricoccus sp.]